VRIFSPWFPLDSGFSSRFRQWLCGRGTGPAILPSLTGLEPKTLRFVQESTSWVLSTTPMRITASNYFASLKTFRFQKRWNGNIRSVASWFVANNAEKTVLVHGRNDFTYSSHLGPTVGQLGCIKRQNLQVHVCRIRRDLDRSLL